jgi:hypothetical protein
MSVNSLGNALSSLALLPSTANLPTNTQTNSPYWNASEQYYKNDIAISPIDQGAYVWLGSTTVDGSSAATNTVRGGDDPSAQTGWWYSLSSLGPPASTKDVNVNVTVTNTGAQSAQTVATSATLTAAQSTTWLVQWSALLTPTSAWTAPDFTNFTFTASGTGASAAVVTMAQPAVNGAATTAPVGVSGVALLTLGTDSSPTATETITPSIVSPSSSQVVTVSNFNILYTLVQSPSVA